MIGRNWPRIIQSKSIRTGRQVAKSIQQTLVMSSVGGHTPFDQEFRSAAEMHVSSLEPDGLDSKIKKQYAILAEGNAPVGLTCNLKRKPTVLASIGQNSRRQGANGKTAQDERPSSERYVLVGLIATIANYKHPVCTFIDQVGNRQFLRNLLDGLYTGAPSLPEQKPQP